MDTFERTVAGILVGLVLWICLQKQEKDMALLLTLCICAMGATVALKAFTPVLEMLQQLETLGQLQNGILSVLMKATGIGLVTELAGMICADAGNGAMEKTVQLLGSITMLVLALPIFQTLLNLIQEILGFT